MAFRDDLPAGRADREPHRRLLPARDGAGEQEIRDVSRTR